MEMKPRKGTTSVMKRTHRAFAAKVSAMVGKRIAERRAMMDLTQTDIGAPIGVTMQQAQRYESGQTPMDVPTLLSISRTLGCKVQDLLVDFEASDQGGSPAPLSLEAVMIGKSVDTINDGGLRAIVKLVVDKLRAYERAMKKSSND